MRCEKSGVFYDKTESVDMYFEGSCCMMQSKQSAPYFAGLFVYVATDGWEMPNFATNF